MKGTNIISTMEIARRLDQMKRDVVRVNTMVHYTHSRHFQSGLLERIKGLTEFTQRWETGIEKAREATK